MKLPVIQGRYHLSRSPQERGTLFTTATYEVRTSLGGDINSFIRMDNINDVFRFRNFYANAVSFLLIQHKVCLFSSEKRVSFCGLHHTIPANAC